MKTRLDEDVRRKKRDCLNKLFGAIQLCCNNSGKTVTVLERELGMKKGRIADMQKGSASKNTVSLVCEHLGISRSAFIPTEIWDIIEDKQPRTNAVKLQEMVEVVAPELDEVANEGNYESEVTYIIADMLIQEATQKLKIACTLLGINIDEVKAND